MVDCGTHQIDLASFWLDSDVVQYDAHGAWVDDYDAPDHIWLHMDHANGAHAMVEMNYSYHHTSKNRPVEAGFYTPSLGYSVLDFGYSFSSSPCQPFCRHNNICPP